MFFHNISPSDVKRGDHLYRWQYLKLLQGIAVQRNDNPSEIFVVISDGFNTFRLVTLPQFKGRGVLRRALYDQGDSYIHPVKLSGTSFIEKKRPAEEIEQNALLLLNAGNTNPEYVQELFPHGSGNFPRLCCTISHEQWRNQLQRNGRNLSSVNNFERVSHLISTTPIDEHEMENKSETFEDKQCCPICMDRICNVVFGCGHLVCRECAESLTICHSCRQDIRQKIPFFWPY